MEDLQKTVSRLFNILGEEERENPKELAMFSANHSEIKNFDNIQVSIDESKAFIVTLEQKLDRTTK